MTTPQIVLAILLAGSAGCVFNQMVNDQCNLDEQGFAAITAIIVMVVSVTALVTTFLC